MKAKTPSGNKCLLIFIDDFSRYRFPYLIAEEMLEEFKEVIETVSNKFLRKMVNDVTRYTYEKR